MRFQVIIDRVNTRLDVATAADAPFDAGLERNASKRGLTGMLFKAINACVWLARAILTQLARAGREMSCLMLRQMEFDADSYEIKLVGSAAFEETMKRLHHIKLAGHEVSRDLARAWSYKKLPDNLPALVQRRSARALGPEGMALLTKALETDTTGQFDTHPSDAARLRAARALNEPGVFTLNGAASGLFSDIDSLCKKATRHEYKYNYGFAFTEENIVTAKLFAEISRNYELLAEATRRFLGDVAIWFAPFFADAVSGPWSRSAISPFPQWRQAKELARRRMKDAEAASEKCRANEARIIQLTTAIALLHARVSIKSELFDLAYGRSRKANAQLAASEREKCLAARASLFASLEPFLEVTRERVLRALDLLEAGEAGSAKNGREAAATGRRLVALSARLEPHWRTIQEMGPDVDAVEGLRFYRARAPDPEEIDSQLSEIAARLALAMGSLRDELGDVPELGFDKTPQAEGRDAVFESAVSVMKAFTELHEGTVGHLFLIVEQIEMRLEADMRTAAMMRAEG
jgi:hypothetical protein